MSVIIINCSDCGATWRADFDPCACTCEGGNGGTWAMSFAAEEDEDDPSV